MRKSLFFLPLFLLFFSSVRAENTPEAVPVKKKIEWRDWSADIFSEAQKEQKFVLLDVRAVWCHWCHVMEETTYQDPKVIELIGQKYIPVQVDQESRPDIALRYEDWGWPATVIFAPDGSELVKRRGYLPPPGMIELLDAVIKDPTPGPSVEAAAQVIPSESPFLSPEKEKKILDEHFSFYDKEFGGWGDVHKLIDPNHLEYAMLKSQSGDKEEEKMARTTLDNALNLLDPEWGGFYQYSDQKNWRSPHYEKIMPVQAQYLRQYALASGIWKDPRYLDAAEKTASYIAEFWTDQGGAFYTSQDADLSQMIPGKVFYGMNAQQRKKFGSSPRIDKRLYSRENGWMIAGLAVLYDMSGKREYLERALRSADWVLEHRSLEAGGFRHGEKDGGGPYLGDSLSMGEAFLELYISTAERKWLSLAEAAALFIHKNFKNENEKGFFSAHPSHVLPGVFQKPVMNVDENISLARWANLLFHYTARKEYRGMAEDAMRFLASDAVAGSRHFLMGVALLDLELSSEPLHITVVGAKEDPLAGILFTKALSYPSEYRVIEWWDKKEGPLPNPAVVYPEMKKAAAFLCADQTCSLPMNRPEALEKEINSRLKSAIRL